MVVFIVVNLLMKGASQVTEVLRKIAVKADSKALATVLSALHPEIQSFGQSNVQKML